MQLQNMRYNDCAEFIADVPPELDSFSIPRLTFQPIVENALLHGIMMKEEKKGTSCSQDGKKEMISYSLSLMTGPESHQKSWIPF